MKVGEITQRIINLYSKGVDSDDTRTSLRLIYNKFIGVRAKLFVQRLAKGAEKNDLTSWDWQPIEKIEMIDVTGWGGLTCSVKKSTTKIPKTISDDRTEHIRVMSFDGSVKINRTTITDAKYISGGKYTKEMPFYFFYDEYLYVINSKIKYITIQGLFRDPVEAYVLHYKNNNNGDVPCVKYTELDIYTPEEIADTAIEMSAKELIEEFVKLGVEDVRNDSRDNPQEKSK